MPRLADFGLSKILGPSEKTIGTAGTLGYMAPEILRKESYSFGCDLWSLGCIIYVMTSGYLPFNNES